MRSLTSERSQSSKIKNRKRHKASRFKDQIANFRRRQTRKRSPPSSEG